MSDTESFGDTPNFRSPQMLALWRNFSLAQRAEKLADLFDSGRELMLEGIRLRAPGISPQEARRSLEHLLKLAYANPHE